jgi:hypothetical protein
MLFHTSWSVLYFNIMVVIVIIIIIIIRSRLLLVSSDSSILQVHVFHNVFIFILKPPPPPPPENSCKMLVIDFLHLFHMSMSPLLIIHNISNYESLLLTSYKIVANVFSQGYPKYRNRASSVWVSAYEYCIDCWSAFFHSPNTEKEMGI